MTTAFLIFGVIWPRFTLIVAWLNGSMPYNETGLVADWLGAFFAPRILIAWWSK